VYEDEHLAVIDKPAGLVVHPAPGHWHDTLVNALVARGTTLAGGAEGRPGIVHRLDRDTSGLMIVAKTDLAHRRLGAAIAARRVRRSYAALAWGHLDAGAVRIDAPVARHAQNRKRMTISPQGRLARTDASVVARFEVADLLRLELHTGRTHQIRVHLEHLGHPIVGDPVYGGGGSRRISGPPRRTAERLERATPRQALHAAALAFRHPVSGAPLEFHAEWPLDLMGALGVVGGEELVARPDPLGYLRFFNRDG
jgi:23S rRNA pseudouridine1911/1915/1917 synthase